MSGLLQELAAAFTEASAGLRGVEKRRMFGCDAFFRDDRIFGLIWKDGRIGVKLPEETSFNELAKVRGVIPWSAGTKVMSTWLLVPEDWHDDQDELTAWVVKAHAQAPLGAAKAKAKKTVAKKTVAKKPVAKTKTVAKKPAAKKPGAAKAKPKSASARAGSKPAKRAR